MSGKTLNYRRPDNRRDQKEQPKEANFKSNDHDSENERKFTNLDFRKGDSVNN